MRGLSWKSITFLGFGLLIVFPGGGAAQPFGGWLALDGRLGGVLIPHQTKLEPAAAITIEGWVRLHDAPPDCRSLIGKNAQRAWWVGVCPTGQSGGGGGLLRSSLRGAGSNLDGGRLPAGEWTHFAVVFDGARHLHYVNGEQVAAAADSGPLPGSGDPVEIGNDVALPGHTPSADLNEIRLWSVARDPEQIHGTISQALGSPQPGLVAVWSLVHNAADALGAFNGTLENASSFGTPSPVPPCSSAFTTLCFAGRFAARLSWRTGTPDSGLTMPTAPDRVTGSGVAVPCPNRRSGLFWFFDPDNWEALVKLVDGCSLNHRYWLFSAATTNVFYRLEVLDTATGSTRIYFNYQGPPAPAVTDTDAFATCP
ncbi:MAG TPA: LamG domain-containing protein [Thermoanaerobaculia bacterium]|nr:LamG domain-containing protein [Thermoanaerobaculia bacterium]